MSNATTALMRSFTALVLSLSPLAGKASDLGVYAPLGSVGFGVGAAFGLSTRFDLRLEYAGGTLGREGWREGIDFRPRHGLSELAVVGDWYPSTDSGFRVGTGLARATSPYVGVGWGTRASQQRGLGLRADLGVAFGRGDLRPPAGGLSASPSVEGVRIDDSTDRQRFQPVFSAGFNYRF
jgi:hypothetical protein